MGRVWRLVPRSRRGWSLVGLVAVAITFAWPMQVTDWNQNAHYALVRALADGTPRVDRTMFEIGDLSTGDVVRYRGHTYAAKPPGLAFMTLPEYLVVRATGMRTTGDPTRILWALRLWSVALPAFVLVLLLAAMSDAVAPRAGFAAAVFCGLGTMLLPYTTLFYAHVPAVALAIAAFFLLWRPRTRTSTARRVFAAGLLAGAAVTVDFQVGLLGIVVFFYALVDSPRLRRGAAYAAGALAGALPTFLYDWWAFGSPWHLPYRGWHEQHGNEQLGGTYGLRRLPSLETLEELLFSTNGLVVASPLFIAGAIGLVLLFRRGYRAESIAIAAAVAAFVAVVSANGFGGLSFPRYALATCAVIAPAVAASLRALPATTISLAAISIVQFVGMTATNPLAEYDGQWFQRLQDGRFAQSAAYLVDITGSTAMLPFAVAAAVAAAAALATAWPLRSTPTDVALAAAVVLGWAVLALIAGNPSGASPTTNVVVGLALTGLAVAAALVAGSFARRRLAAG